METQKAIGLPEVVAGVRAPSRPVPFAAANDASWHPRSGQYFRRPSEASRRVPMNRPERIQRPMRAIVVIALFALAMPPEQPRSPAARGRRSTARAERNRCADPDSGGGRSLGRTICHRHRRRRHQCGRAGDRLVPSHPNGIPDSPRSRDILNSMATTDRELLLGRIWIDPARCGGRPCIRGHRIWVSLVLDLLASGATPPEILAEYPGLEEEDIRACLAYASEIARERFVDLPLEAS